METPSEKHQYKAYEEIEEEEDLKKKGALISESKVYQFMVKTAYRLLNKPLTILGLLKKAVARIQSYDTVRHLAQDTKDYLLNIIRLVRAYVNGEYREVSKQNIALSMAAILYFLSPIDLIPDFITTFGLVDDVAVLLWVYENFRDEIEAFLQWEDQQKTRIEIGKTGYEDENTL